MVKCYQKLALKLSESITLKSFEEIGGDQSRMNRDVKVCQRRRVENIRSYFWEETERIAAMFMENHIARGV